MKRIQPYYIIKNFIVYGGAEVHFYPEQTVVAKWEVRDFEDETLRDADSHDIKVYDSQDGLRISYNSANLEKESTGVYKYMFDIPSSVIEGDWYIKIKATLGDKSTVGIIHFEVKKK